jgi:hypothetical protein
MLVLFLQENTVWVKICNGPYSVKDHWLRRFFTQAQKAMMPFISSLRDVTKQSEALVINWSTTDGLFNPNLLHSCPLRTSERLFFKGKRILFLTVQGNPLHPFTNQNEFWRASSKSDLNPHQPASTASRTMDLPSLTNNFNDYNRADSAKQNALIWSLHADEYGHVRSTHLLVSYAHTNVLLYIAREYFCKALYQNLLFTIILISSNSSK